MQIQRMKREVDVCGRTFGQRQYDGVGLDVIDDVLFVNVDATFGSGGKVIQRIVAETGVKIDIEDDGTVFFATTDSEAAEKALRIVRGIAGDIEIGDIFSATVTKIMEFGAFVEYLPGKEGLVHISKLDTKRVDKVTDVVNVGDQINVMLVEVDRMGRYNFSRKDALLVAESENTQE